MLLGWRWSNWWFLQGCLLQVVEVWHPGARRSGKGGSVLPWFDAELLGCELSPLCPLQSRNMPAGLYLPGEGVARLAVLGLAGAAHPWVAPALSMPPTFKVARFRGRLRWVREGALEAQVWWRGRRVLSLIWGWRGEMEESAKWLEGLALVEEI